MSVYWEGHLETALLSEKKNWVIRQLAVLPPWTLTGPQANSFLTRGHLAHLIVSRMA